MLAHRMMAGIATSLCILATLTACSMPDRVDTPSMSSAFRDRLVALGFDPSGAIDVGDYVRVEGDILVPKEALQGNHGIRSQGTPAASSLSAHGPLKQWVTDTLVSASNVGAITVDLSQIAGDTTWLSAARAAMANWNALPGTSIHFAEASPGDITMKFYSEGNGSPPPIAISAFPLGIHEPGPYVWINEVYSSYSHSEKEFVLTHELGHTLGFRHTDWQGKESSYYAYSLPDGYHTRADGATQVSGTPATDAISVMNAATGGHSWTGFSPYDSTAAMIVYPTPSTITESNSGGFPKLSWASARGATSVDVQIEVVSQEVDDSYQWFTTADNYLEAVPISTTATSFVDSAHPWAGAECSDPSNFPYPDQRTFYRVTFRFPRGVTRTLGASANVQNQAFINNSTYYAYRLNAATDCF
jgi:Dual-action HEIGH metallo-peptidase